MQIIDKVITILIFAIIIRTLLSWFPPRTRPNQLVTLLYDITDPFLRPFRRFQISSGGMGMDFSPLIAIFVLGIIQNLFDNLIVRLFF